MRRRLCAMLALLLYLLPLSGCRSIDELYAPPRQSEEFYALQRTIDELTARGADYAAPAAGVNRQPVQFADLDGDGTDEALVFLKSGSEMPLKLHILKQDGEDVSSLTTIEGDGAGFSSAEYAQIDGQPGLEIILGRQIGDQVLQSLSVYALREGRAVELMSANCTAYTTTDLDADGCTDLFLLRRDAGEEGVAEYYRCRNGQIEREPEALTSSGAGAVRRIVSGKVAGGVPAVFVASLYGEDGIVTDIFALRDESFLNITTAGAAGTTAGTVRNYYVYGADIDNDGVIELPQPVQLPSWGAPGETYWTIDWYKLDLYGKRERSLTTWHNFPGGWYVTIPEDWEGKLTISRGAAVSGVRGYVFSRWEGPPALPEEIFTIYAFAGKDSGDLAQQDGRFILAEKGGVTYAASLGTCEEARALTRDGLKSLFDFIRVDWNNGEVLQ